jgi:hypothetical protein
LQAFAAAGNAVVVRIPAGTVTPSVGTGCHVDDPKPCSRALSDANATFEYVLHVGGRIYVDEDAPERGLDLGLTREFVASAVYSKRMGLG